MLALTLPTETTSKSKFSPNCTTVIILKLHLLVIRGGILSGFVGWRVTHTFFSQVMTDGKQMRGKVTRSTTRGEMQHLNSHLESLHRPALCRALAVDLCPRARRVTLGPWALLGCSAWGHRRHQLQPLPGAHGLGLGHIVIFAAESCKTAIFLKAALILSPRSDLGAPWDSVICCSPSPSP